MKDSREMAYFTQKLQERMGDVKIVFCLDSGCLTYDTFYYTTSLRGIIETNLSV